MEQWLLLYWCISVLGHGLPSLETVPDKLLIANGQLLTTSKIAVGDQIYKDRLNHAYYPLSMFLIYPCLFYEWLLSKETSPAVADHYE